MEITSIVTIILVSGLVVERILKHFKKSKCITGEVEFNNDVQVPDLTGLIKV